MPSYKDSILLPHLFSPLLHPLEDDDAVITHSFSPSPKLSHRKYPNRLSDAFSCDDFRMYDYKVRRCMRGRSHDWTDCPFAHPGEKARRRDPRKIHYSGEPCPDFRKGSCRRGDACDYAHGVFECWLHPARYRTLPCKDGKDCTRKVCFFAHSMQQLRHVAVPVEESVAEEAPMDSHVNELYSRTHELGSPVGMGLLEDSFKERVAMVDSYEDEVGLTLPTNSSALSRRDVYANVGSISETLSMLTLSCENLSGSPFEAIATMGFSSNNAMGVPLEMHPPSPNFEAIATMGFSSNNAMGVPLEVHPPSPNFSTVARKLPSSGMGAISKNDPSMFEQSTAPVIFSSASSLQLYNTPVVEGLCAANSHTTSDPLPYGGGSQAAARQTFLMCEGYCKGGESLFNANAHEIFDMVHYGGYGDMAMLHAVTNATRRGRPLTNEVANELSGTSKLIDLTDQLALSTKEMYEFSRYNRCGIYGLSSPTSTLAGPSYLSPFSSPPLSPLSTPSSEASNVISSIRHGNVQVDCRNPKADALVQKLKLKRIFTDQQSLHSNFHSQPLGYGALPQYHESSSFFQCTSRQNKWIPRCNNWNSEESYNRGVSQLSSDDMRQEICDRFGGEGLAEIAMPDLGWVHELVM